MRMHRNLQLNFQQMLDKMTMSGVLKNYEPNCDGPPMPHKSMSHFLACRRSLHLYLQQKDTLRCSLSAVHPSLVEYCTAYAIIGGVNPGSAAYNLGNMKPVQLESLFSKKIGCPFWKMKPSTSGLPCIEVLVWLSVLENETQFSSKGGQ